MKAINTLALAAFMITLVGYLLSASPSAPAESGGDRTVVDLLPARRQPAPVLAATTPTPKPVKPEPNPMADALANNDLCAVMRLKQKNYGLEKNDLLALAATIGPSDSLAELLSAQGPLLATTAPKTGFIHRSSRFLWAMRLAGYGYGVSNVAENLVASRQLFLDMEQDDPGNGALPYFRLAVEKKLNFDAQILADTADKIAAAAKFETYLDDLAGEIQQASWQSPALSRLYQITGYYTVSTPSFYASWDVLQAMKLPAPTLEGIGRLMMQKAQTSAQPIKKQEYFADQYEVGRALAKSDAASIYVISEEREKALNLPPVSFPYFEVTDTECNSREYEEYFYANRGRY